MTKIDSEELKREAEKIKLGVSMLQPQMYAVSDLKPYEKNSKVHDKAHIERLAANIEQEGLQESLLIEEDGTIVTGHGRHLAVQKLNWQKVPVRIMEGYSKAQCMIHRVSSNLTVSNKFDSSKQAEELSIIQSLLDDDVSLEQLAASTGYSERDIEVLSDDIADLSAFEDLDLNAEIETQSTNEQPVVEQADKPKKMVRLSKLFGFDEVTPEVSRVIRKFLALAGIEDAESLECFCNQYILASEVGDE